MNHLTDLCFSKCSNIICISRCSKSIIHRSAFMVTCSLKIYLVYLIVSRKICLYITCFIFCRYFNLQQKSHLKMPHTPLLHPENSMLQNIVLFHSVLFQFLETYMPKFGVQDCIHTLVYVMIKCSFANSSTELDDKITSPANHLRRQCSFITTVTKSFPVLHQDISPLT